MAKSKIKKAAKTKKTKTEKEVIGGFVSYDKEAVMESIKTWDTSSDPEVYSLICK